MTSSTADVRQFLTDYFSDEELTTLCFDYFAEVYDSFASGMSKGQKIHLLIEYSRRREQLTELLKVLQQQRPVQFARRLQPASAAPTSSTSGISGGVSVDANTVTVGEDVVGRDKIVQAGTYIEHATIIQPSSPPPEAASAPNTMTWGGLQFVRVPAGKFIMGSDRYDDEKPLHIVKIPYDYWIARYPVTKEQFARFVASSQYTFDQGDWRNKANHPVVRVTWHNAMAYCRWLNDTLRGELKDQTLRLPTEAEWEKAVRGDLSPVANGRATNEWPWGNEFDRNKCNSAEGGKGGTTPVGAYSPQGDSPYGAADMAGNVWEWCHSLYRPYPYQADDGRENENDNHIQVTRGGSWYDDSVAARCASRGRVVNGYFYANYVGFRVVMSPGLG